MSSTETFCVFCVKKKKEKIKLFTEITLDKCLGILEIRKKNKLQFQDIILPCNVNTSEGYHLKCYSNFTGLMAKYKNKEENSADKISSPLVCSPSLRLECLNLIILKLLSRKLCLYTYN